MWYEVISEIKNSCKNNQMRDIFFDEIEIDDPDLWIKEKEPKALSITKEDHPGGVRYVVMNAEIPTVYTLTRI